MLPVILFNKSSQLRIYKNRGAVLYARHDRCFWTHGILHYHHLLSRSSLLEMFCIKGVLRNFAEFTGKHLRQRIFNNKVTDLRPAALLKKILWHRGFPVNFAKFLRAPFFIEHLWWLLLYIKYHLYTCLFQFILQRFLPLYISMVPHSTKKEISVIYLSWRYLRKQSSRGVL